MTGDDRVSRNVAWQLSGGEEPDTETAFLLKICNVVVRLIDEEWRVLRLMNMDIAAAGVANHYVNVAVANAGLRVHAAVHRLLDARVPPDTGRLVREPDWNCLVGQLRGDPSFDLRVLAEIRKSTFRAKLEQAVGVDDWWPTTTPLDRDDAVVGRVDRDEAAARKFISDEVDRVVKQHGCTVRENVERCDTSTLAKFGAALGQDYARSAATHRAVMDTLTEQLWTSAIDAASRQLAEQLTVISSLTVVDAADRVSHWLSRLSRSTSMKVWSTHGHGRRNREGQGKHSHVFQYLWQAVYLSLAALQTDLREDTL